MNEKIDCDTNIDKNMDLIEFINQEKSDKKINTKKIFNYFNKCLIKSFIELENKFSNIENKKDSVISGTNMIFHIYFILISYTNNIKLTVFLLERSILLFSEFIVMSQDKSIIDDICFVPNITDAISFSYKKTIGPLAINTINNLKKEQAFIKDISNIIKNIFQQIYVSCNENDLSIILTETNIILETIIYKLFEKINKNKHNFIIKLVNTILILNNTVNIKITKIKIILENMLFYICYKKTLENFDKTFVYILEKYIVLNNDIDLIDTKHYKNTSLYKLIKNYIHN